MNLYSYLRCPGAHEQPFIIDVAHLGYPSRAMSQLQRVYHHGTGRPNLTEGKTPRRSRWA